MSETELRLTKKQAKVVVDWVERFGFILITPTVDDEIDTTKLAHDALAAHTLLADRNRWKAECEKLASLNLAALNNLLESHEGFRRDASAQQSKLRARCDSYRKTLKEVQATLSDDYSNREYITRLIDAALEKEQSNA